MAIKCEFCSMEYETSPGKFCDRCGRAMARVTVEPDEDGGTEYHRCLNCGHNNHPDERVCANCGEALHTPHMS